MTTADPAVPVQVPPRDIGAELIAEFEETHKRSGGGSEQFEYITGEQCITRLNEVYGHDGWSYFVREHGINQEADEAWVLGEIVVRSTGVTKQQFGSEKIKRLRSSGVPMDLGFNLKGAATDAMKKCASLLGVGLYLYHREGIVRAAADTQAAQPAPAPARAAQASTQGQQRSQQRQGQQTTRPAQQPRQAPAKAASGKAADKDAGTGWGLVNVLLADIKECPELSAITAVAERVKRAAKEGKLDAVMIDKLAAAAEVRKKALAA